MSERHQGKSCWARAWINLENTWCEIKFTRTELEHIDQVRSDPSQWRLNLYEVELPDSGVAGSQQPNGLVT